MRLCSFRLRFAAAACFLLLAALIGFQVSFVPAIPSSALDPAAPAAEPSSVAANFGKLPMCFEANIGQFKEGIDFVTRAGGFEAGLHAQGAYFVGTPAQPADPKNADNMAAPPQMSIAMNFVGANANAAAAGADQLATRTNYLIGNDPSRHFANVPNYGAARYQNVYNGIDVNWHASAKNSLEYDFVVAAGADPSQIALRFSGVTGIDQDQAGNLILHTAGGDIREHAPVSYQDINGSRQQVDSCFVVGPGGEVRFQLGHYDRNYALTIDPKWSYVTYLGGRSEDSALGIVLSGWQNPAALITGYSYSSAFWNGATMLPGARIVGGQRANVFVAKLRSDGTVLDYLTYIGGTAGNSFGRAIAADNTGAVYVTGYTSANNFYTIGPWQAAIGGGKDVFALKLNPLGTAGVYSTYIGNGGDEEAWDIAIDYMNRAYIAGRTTNNDNINNVAPTRLKITGSGVGPTDAVVARLRADGTVDKLMVLGGDRNDSAEGIAVDSADPVNIYITGKTQGANKINGNKGSFHFKTTNKAFRTTPFPPRTDPNTNKQLISQAYDAFVTKINTGRANQSPALVYSTLFGNTGKEIGRDIAIEPTDFSVYVVGSTTTPAGDGFVPDGNKPPLRPRTFGKQNGGNEAWVARFDPQGRPDKNGYFVYLQGSRNDIATGVALGSGNNPKVAVTGETSSPNFPTKSVLQPFNMAGRAPGFDAFAVILDPFVANNGNDLIHSTFIGGTHNDRGNAVAIDASDNVYVAGQTASNNIRPAGPVPLPGAQALYGGGGDGFVVKIAP